MKKLIISLIGLTILSIMSAEKPAEDIYIWNENDIEALCRKFAANPNSLPSNEFEALIQSRCKECRGLLGRARTASDACSAILASEKAVRCFRKDLEPLTEESELKFDPNGIFLN